MALFNSLARNSPSPRLLRRDDIKAIAVFRALRLGDMLCAVPALRALRATLPHASITLIGMPWAEEFARRFPDYIDDFVTFPGHPALPEQAASEDAAQTFYRSMQLRRFDLALQLHGSGETSNHVVQEFGARLVAGFCPPGSKGPAPAYFLPWPHSGLEPVRLLNLVRFLGAHCSGHALEFPLNENDRRELHEAGLPPGLGHGNYICIHPGASTIAKCWPLKRFAEIGDRLHQEFGLPIVLTGSGKEVGLVATLASHMKAKAINAAAPISIGAMAALMKRARLLICNDTGVSHIAAGLGLPSVVIFSTADIRRWAPLNQRLHRCIWDPEGRRASSVLDHARSLLIS